MKTLKLGEGMVTINLSKPAAYLADSHAGFHRDHQGSFEVFWVGHSNPMGDEQGSPMADGWYVWSCLPGCLPDGDATGPFDTSSEAHAQALNADTYGNDGELPEFETGGEQGD